MGRKKLPNVKRVKGRISQAKDDKQARRSLEQQDAMAVARLGRERVLGVPHAESATERAGWYVGRLLIGGLLAEYQYRAATDFAADYNRYARAMGLPAPPRAVDLNGVHGRGLVAENQEMFDKALDRWYQAKKVVVRANDRRAGAIYAAAYYCVLMDQELPHLLPDLRIALDALAAHYHIDRAMRLAA